MAQSVSPASIVSSWLIRIAAMGLVIMVVITSWQVFGRFVLDSSPSWTEQASLVLMIWYVMFAAAAGVYEGFHIKIGLLEERLGDRAKPLLRLVTVIVALLSLALCFYGAQLCWLVRANVIPSLGISRAVAYVPLPISGGLMAIFAVGRFIHPEHSVSLEETI